ARATTENNESVLDYLPPLDLPSDVTDRTVTPPIAPAAERKPVDQAPAASANSPQARENEVALAAAQPAPESSTPAGSVPGISRFVAVDLKVAAGSLPTTAGLSWLADKGYKTVVDLRETAEISSAFIADATARGLRYIALPTSPGTLNREHLARFNLELAS